MPKFMLYCFNTAAKWPEPFSTAALFTLMIVWAIMVLIGILIPVVVFAFVVAIVSPNSKCVAEALGSECHYSEGHGHPSHDGKGEEDWHPTIPPRLPRIK